MNEFTDSNAERSSLREMQCRKNYLLRRNGYVI